MKKIALILLALTSGIAFGQDGARSSATADVLAEIVSPIEIADGTPLNFGRIIGNADGGNVRVDINSNRTFSNPDSNAPSTGADTPTAAKFDVTAASGYAFNVYIPATILSGAGDDMDISFTHSLAASGNTGTGEPESLYVGGLLSVNPDQLEGEYTGTVTVTVAYE